MTVATRRGVFKVAAIALALLALCAPPATTQVPPDASWRTIATDRFRVTYPEGLEALARRALAHAERALAELEAAFIDPPEGVIDILLTDHVDDSNGFATIFPSNRVVLYARPPIDDLGLGYFDEWLELLVTHELAHVVHLDRTVNPLGRLFRAVLGRYPVGWPVFTGAEAPRWTVEGLATWYESQLTDAGRVHGTYHEMIVRTAILEGRFAGIDQAGGESPVWPAGQRAYAYGSLFFDWLLERHGERRMGDFVTAVAGQWIPYRLNAAARSAFDVSFSEEWRAWRQELERRYAGLDQELLGLGPITSVETLTSGARWALHPRPHPNGSDVAYLRSDGRSDTQIRLLEPEGGEGRRIQRANGFATLDWAPGVARSDDDPDEPVPLLVSQLEFEDPYRIYGDLYLVDPRGGEERITEGARLGHASAAPDGPWAVAVAEGGGTNGLSLIDLATGQETVLVAPAPDVHWAFPRVSPDGEWIAVSRWTQGGFLDVVVLDASGEVVLELTRDRALDLAPSWSPDGHWVVWGSDRTGIFNVLASRVDPAAGTAGAPVLVTNLRTGAAYPAVDAEGGWVYFSGYHAEGWEIERAPFDPESAPPAPAPLPRFGRPGPYAPPEPVAVGTGPEDYSPWPTLRPFYWEPVLEEPVTAPGLGRDLLGIAYGAQTSGADLVGRHAYGVSASYRPTGRVLDAGAAYFYAGLGNPVLSVGASQAWGYGGFARPDPATTLYVRERDRSVLAGVTIERQRWRRSAALTLSGGLAWEHLELLGPDLRPSTAFELARPERRFADLRATLSFSTARSFAFQMGGARGVRAVLRARARPELALPDSLRGELGADRSFQELVGQVSGYRTLGGPGYASHVLAARLSGGAARGPAADQGHFAGGGAAGSPEAITGLALFGGSGLAFPVRGYASGARFGRYAWSASGEYRFPLAIFDRGLGAWPLHVDRVAGALFVDAGNAWGPELGVGGYQNPPGTPMASVGAELTTQTLFFWSDALRFRVGAALPLTDGPREVLYLRLGLAF